MDMEEQEKLENRIMEKLLVSFHPVAVILRNQYQNSEINSREFTGAGFFTHFSVKNGIDAAPKKSFEIGGVYADIGRIKDAIGFVLFIRDGYIDWLEGYTLSVNSWPDTYKHIKLKVDDAKVIAKYNRIFDR